MTAMPPTTPFLRTRCRRQVELGGLQYTAAAESTVNIGSRPDPGHGRHHHRLPVGRQHQPGDHRRHAHRGADGGTLGILQNSTGTFTIASQIVDNGGATGFVKGGTGTVILTTAPTPTPARRPEQRHAVRHQHRQRRRGERHRRIRRTLPPIWCSKSGTLSYTGGTATTDRGFTLVNGGPCARRSQVPMAPPTSPSSGLVTSPDDAGFTKTGTGTLTLANAANDYTASRRSTAALLSVGHAGQWRAGQRHRRLQQRIDQPRPQRRRTLAIHRRARRAAIAASPSDRRRRHRRQRGGHDADRQRHVAGTGS